MAIEFKTSNTKAELLEIAAANGVEVADDMTKAQIIAALEARNAAGAAEAGDGAEDTAGSGNAPQGGAGAAGSTPGNDDGGSGAGGNDPDAPQTATNAAGSDEAGNRPEDTAGGGNAPQGGAGAAGSAPKEDTPEEEDTSEYNMFVYAGPSLPRGRLKENAVFRGTFKDVAAYLKDVLADYPQVVKLIVPAHKLGVFSVKVKTPGNVAHKYYNDIVSAMRNHKEV